MKRCTCREPWVTIENPNPCHVCQGYVPTDEEIEAEINVQAEISAQKAINVQAEISAQKAINVQAEKEYMELVQRLSSQ